MSDGALTTGKYPAYSTEYLRDRIAAHAAGYIEMHPDVVATMKGEIARRERRDSGDASAMTASERLRNARATSPTP